MKRIYLILPLLILLACKENETMRSDTLLGEWRWVKTTYDTRGVPVTSEEVDSTFFYVFAENELQILDGNRNFSTRHPYRLTHADESEIIYLADEDLTWAYTIRLDTLQLWAPYDILPETLFFRRVK